MTQDIDTGSKSGLPPAPQTYSIRRQQLRQIVPLSDTTIYELEMRGLFPRRFNLTNRCVAWDLGEVKARIEQRRQESQAGTVAKSPVPDIRLRRTHPVKMQGSQ